jgi:hypothetical protein
VLVRLWSAIRLAFALLFVIAACIAGLPFPSRRGRVASRAAATQRVVPQRRVAVSADRRVALGAGPMRDGERDWPRRFCVTLRPVPRRRR